MGNLKGGKGLGVGVGKITAEWNTRFSAGMPGLQHCSCSRYASSETDRLVLNTDCTGHTNTPTHAGVGVGCGFGVGWGFGGAPIGILGASVGGGCGVGVGVGMGAGAGMGTWYINSDAAFEERKQPKVVALFKKFLPAK